MSIDNSAISIRNISDIKYGWVKTCADGAHKRDMGQVTPLIKLKCKSLLLKDSV